MVQVDDEVGVGDLVGGMVRRREGEIEPFFGEDGVCDHARMAREIVYLYLQYCREWIGMPERYFVMEDFILHSMGSTGVTGIAPARIGWYVQGMIAGIAYDRALLGDFSYWGEEGPRVRPVWYPVGAFGSRARTDARLREYGLWVRGKEHARDAWRVWVHHLRVLRKSPAPGLK
jgi:hypothetical protein